MAQARTEFAAALNQIASEKGVDVSVVIDAIEQAALAAYRKDLTLRNEEVPENFEEFTSKVDPVSGEISIFNGKKNVTPPGFARIAASIARQVILQKLHEAEKGAIMDEYESKVNTVISGVVQRQEGNTWFVDLGRAEGIMPPSEQIRGEYYHTSQRLKFFIKEIRDGSHGPEVIVSRADPALVKGLFALEVPEVQNGSVEVKVIAREAGGRTKIAVVSTQDGVDPVGSLVGQKGVRVQAVMQELGEEKIDIIAYSEDPAHFIASSLSPAKDIQVFLNEEEKIATVKIPSSQLSLAIGKGGQNVRLAAKLTGWKIDIEGIEEEIPEEEKVAEVKAEEVVPETAVPEGVEEVTSEAVSTEEPTRPSDGGKVEELPAEETAVTPEPEIVTEETVATEPESEEAGKSESVQEKEQAEPKKSE
ncbi:MAG: transcription termination factor NusA [Candidatus Daviesbacteria bacterium]|nr:transcription termination factor NusA [Candidatus Daviesbacteria bacterium]